MSSKLVIIGSVVHTKELGKLEILEKARVVVNQETGLIESVEVDFEDNRDDDKVLRLAPGQFLCPGLVDAHYHAPQTANLGLGLDDALLEWLQKFTFPREGSFTHRTDSEISTEYSQMAQRLLAAGTTCCVYFGSVQKRANEILVREVQASGQRAFIGKVCMDQNSPDYYRDESSESALKETKEFIEYVESLADPLIKPVVTPRFAPSCTSGLMNSLAEVAKDCNCMIQTHLSENRNEVTWVKELFPASSSYTAVYDDHGLLTEKTILAHSVHLSSDEKELIKERGAIIAHCPNSNFALTSGAAEIRDLINRGVKVALGTDVAGGYAISIIDVMRQAIIASKMHYFADASLKFLSAPEAFYLATMGGAIAVGQPDRLGSLEVGKFFDALLIDIHANPQIPPVVPFEVNLPASEFLRMTFEKFIFCGDDRCIRQVYVAGKLVSQK